MNITILSNQVHEFQVVSEVGLAPHDDMLRGIGKNAKS